MFEEPLDELELEILRERETLKPLPCVCGKHTFDVDEIQMGSICPSCNKHQDGSDLLAISHDGPVFNNRDTYFS